MRRGEKRERGKRRERGERGERERGKKREAKVEAAFFFFVAGEGPPTVFNKVIKRTDLPGSARGMEQRKRENWRRGPRRPPHGPPDERSGRWHQSMPVMK